MVIRRCPRVLVLLKGVLDNTSGLVYYKVSVKVLYSSGYELFHVNINTYYKPSLFKKYRKRTKYRVLVSN